MNEKNKRNIIFGSIFAVLLLPPLIAFAVVYNSVQRKNSFKPAEAKIEVAEGNSSGAELEKEFTFSSSNSAYSVEKPVAVYDVCNKNDEYLRVSFIPMWYDEKGFVCGAIDGISDYKKISLEDNKLIYKDSNDNELLTLYLADNWNNSWEFDDQQTYKQQAYFYYKGLIKSDKTTPDLLERVEIPSIVYDAAKEDYTLRIDVLADAVQQYGDAPSARGWSISNSNNG